MRLLRHGRWYYERHHCEANLFDCDAMVAAIMDFATRGKGAQDVLKVA